LFSVCFFFSSRRRHTRCYRDWSSDVCSSDLLCFSSHSAHAAKRSREAGTTVERLRKSVNRQVPRISCFAKTAARLGSFAKRRSGIREFLHGRAIRLVAPVSRRRFALSDKRSAQKLVPSLP